MSSGQQFSKVKYVDNNPSQLSFHIDEIIKNSFIQCKWDFEYSIHKKWVIKASTIEAISQKYEKQNPTIPCISSKHKNNTSKRI